MAARGGGCAVWGLGGEVGGRGWGEWMRGNGCRARGEVGGIGRDGWIVGGVENEVIALYCTAQQSVVCGVFV